MKRSTLLPSLRELFPDATPNELFARILCGEIRVNGTTVRSPRELVPADAVIEYSPRRRFVSRGGEKLDGILERWRIPVSGLRFIDAGSSTGGFTDCLLRRGARAVIAVEKGFNQLDFRLRRDSRVSLLEKHNVMDLTLQSLPFAAHAAVADLSLRSVRSAAAHILSLVPGGWLIALVKPQYERRRPISGSSGVVRSREEVVGVLRDLVLALRVEGLSVERAAPSPLAGTKGNREFFFQIRESRAAADHVTPDTDVLQSLPELVAEAFPG